MSDFAIKVRVLETGTEQPIPGAQVSGTLMGARTGADGIAIVQGYWLTITAEGYYLYDNQPYFRPSLDAPITVRLRRKPAAP